MTIITYKGEEPTYYLEIEEDEEAPPWHIGILNYHKKRQYLLDSLKLARGILRHLALQFIEDVGILYKNTTSGINL